MLRKPSQSLAESKQEIIFIMGGPGSGKGTQCDILQKSKGYRHISPGDLIRKLLSESKESAEESKGESELQKMRAAIKQGALLDDQMIINLIKTEMQKYPDAPGFLIDGCPRTLEQIALFEKEIKPCDKILYFQTSEKVMRERVLKRGSAASREDDNESAITNRLRIYQEKTLLVIRHFQETRREAFKTIDASGNIESVAKQVRHAVADDSIASVNFLKFLHLYFTRGNFYAAVDELEKQHGTTNFKVGLAFTTMFFIIQNRNQVERILNANTKLGHHYNNFNVSHHHPLNVVATQAFQDEKSREKNPIWQSIHIALAQSVGDRKSVSALIDKHVHKLFSKPTFALDVAFEEFMLDFWCEYLFGPKIDPTEYRKTREKLLAATHYTYYDSHLKVVPYLGNLACRFYGYLKGNQFREIDQELTNYIRESDSGLFNRFRTALERSHFPKHRIDQAVLDNAFDFVLVFDFIHNAMYESLAFVVKNELHKTEDRRSVYTNGLRNAFLFPYRSRVPQESITLGNTTIAKGTPIYINLLESGFPHSHGPRSCIGAGVSNWIQEAIWRHLEDKQLHVLFTIFPGSSERAKLSHSLDVPISPTRYYVRWDYPRDYLQRALPDYQFKGVAHFYDVLKTYENPALVGYIVSSFIEKIERLKIDASELCIAAPEVRGVPIAAMIANQLRVPFIMIRKPEKIPGHTLSESYQTAYSKDTVEISVDSQVKKNVILIDDGIASGGTTLACCHLLEKLGGNIRGVFAMINHTYSQKPRELEKYHVETLFDFENRTLRLVHQEPSNEAAGAGPGPNIVPESKEADTSYFGIGALT